MKLKNLLGWGCFAWAFGAILYLVVLFISYVIDFVLAHSLPIMLLSIPLALILWIWLIDVPECHEGD